MIDSDTLIARDSTWGGTTSEPKSVGDVLAFRLTPVDGLAAYPRTVEVTGRHSGKVLVTGPGWIRRPGTRAVNVRAEPMALASTWAALSAVTPAGFDVTAPPSETWCIETATEDCDLNAAPPAPPRSQILWTVDSPKIPTNAAHDVVTPLFNTAPWRAVLVSLFTTDETAECHVSGFMDVTAAGSAIGADLVIGNLAGLGSVDLVTGAAAPSQPSQVGVLFTDEVAAAGASTMKVTSDRLLPYLFGWHDFFGTHDVRITYRGYR